MNIDFQTDYHAHILLGCDHGSKNILVSRTQLDLARRVGITTVCATPHFYPNQDTVKSFLERRKASWEQLKTVLKPDDPKILLGAEVLICEGLELMEDLRELCLEGTSQLLLEMPFFKWDKTLVETVLELNARSDVQIVMAHADRYSPKDVKVWIEHGIPLQLNIDSLDRLFSGRKYKKWIQDGYVSYVGSDIHGTKDAYKHWPVNSNHF